jgi:hypothetical protein
VPICNRQYPDQAELLRKQQLRQHDADAQTRMYLKKHDP